MDFFGDLKDRAVLVTGASSGFGAHFASLLARCGARLAIAARRVDQLEALDGTPRRGFAGTWINLGGAVTIEAGPKGLEISVSASDGAVGRWLCDFAGVGRMSGATLVAEEAPGSNDYEGWKLTIVRDGQALRVTSERPAGFDGAPPFCGAHGAVDGVYIAARNPN